MVIEASVIAHPYVSCSELLWCEIRESVDGTGTSISEAASDRPMEQLIFSMGSQWRKEVDCTSEEALVQPVDRM
jgi:hypothetical protein